MSSNDTQRSDCILPVVGVPERANSALRLPARSKPPVLNLLLSVTDTSRWVIARVSPATWVCASMHVLSPMALEARLCGLNRPHVHVPGVGGGDISSAKALVLLLFDMESEDASSWTSPGWDWREWITAKWGVFNREFTAGAFLGRLSEVRSPPHVGSLRCRPDGGVLPLAVSGRRVAKS